MTLSFIRGLHAAPEKGTVAPDMSTLGMTEQVGEALFGKTQRTLLALFFTRPDEEFYLRQIVRMARMGQGAAQRELARWVAAGLLTRTRRGQQVYYQANRAAPIFVELQSLAVKTTGVAEVLRKALAGLAAHITVAFVHGSLTKGTVKAGSDVDVLVIGNTAFREVVSALLPAQETIGREVNPTVYAEQEFRAKLQAKHHFLTAVMGSPKVFIVGGEDELKRLAEGTMVGRA